MIQGLKAWFRKFRDPGVTLQDVMNRDVHPDALRRQLLKGSHHLIRVHRLLGEFHMTKDAEHKRRVSRAIGRRLTLLRGLDIQLPDEGDYRRLQKHVGDLVTKELL